MTGSGLVKPDIVFFGEGLPAKFHELAEIDFIKADLLLVMGTSLAVCITSITTEKINL